MKRSFWAVIGLTVIFSVPAAAQSVEAMLTEKGRSALSGSKSSVGQAMYNFTDDQSLIFRKGILGGIFDRNIEEIKPNYLQEAVYFEARTMNIAHGQDLENYNKLLDLKSLSSAYIDKSKGGNSDTAPLFTNIRIFSDATFKTEVKAIEPVTVIPPAARYYAIMRDERFGNVRYAIDFTYQNGVMGISITNLARVKFVFWNVAEPEGLRISFYIVPVSNGYAYMAQIAAAVSDIDAMRKRVNFPTFFSRRIEGIKGWVFNRLYGVNLKQSIGITDIEVL
jgi:hypothetical protein